LQTKPHRSRVFALRFFGFVGLLGCAASPEVPVGKDDLGDVEGDTDDATTPDAAAEPPADEEDPDPPEPMSERPAAVVDAQAARDAASAAVRDAAPAVSQPDAQRPQESLRDASPPAAAADAASGPVMRPDAGASSADAAVVDGARPPSTPRPGSCQRSSDCNQLCAFTGIIPCCGEDRMCGCTWAPGAYCL
jgi:hypothetical protein